MSVNPFTTGTRQSEDLQNNAKYNTSQIVSYYPIETILDYICFYNISIV